MSPSADPMLHVTLKSAHCGPRAEYVTQALLVEGYGMKVTWEEDPGMGPWTSLSVEGQERVRWSNHPLLREESGLETEVMWGTWSTHSKEELALHVPCWTAMDPQDGVLPFDPLAVSFHGLVCWEEQAGRLPLDVHGRPSPQGFPWCKVEGMATWGGHRLAMAQQHRWPWVDLMWNELLSDAWSPAEVQFHLEPTFDIDVAFKHAGRSRTKSWLLSARDVVLGRWSVVKERFQVLSGRLSDPYDTYGWIREVHREEPLTWFVLAANRQRPYDVGLDPEGEALPALVESLGHHVAGSKVCWHPGHAALDHPDRLGLEGKRFGSWKGTFGGMVRTHFLRGNPRRWWPQLEALGIGADASLGWAQDVGYRSGVSRPFQAYDLASDRPLQVNVHPVVVMDSAMKNGLNWSPEEAKEHVDAMVAVASAVGGVWMSCFHNTSVSDHEEWKGWRATYLHMVECVRRGAKRTL